MCFAPQRRALFQHLNFQKWSENGVFCTFWLRNVLRATTACTFSTSQLPKVVRPWCVWYILTLKSQRCALFQHLNFQKWSDHGVFCTFWLWNHNVVHFFNISTSKSGPNPLVNNTFYFQMCFAPQRRALFQHRNFQKWSDAAVFLYLFTSKSASRHNGVQPFISHLPRCLRTRRFSEATFQPSGATKPRKNTVFRDFPTFSRTCIFFLLIFSLLTLLPADCFFISPYCRKFDF